MIGVQFSVVMAFPFFKCLVWWLFSTQIVELLSKEDVDLTPEQIRDIVDLMAKESRVRKANDQSVNDNEESESAHQWIDTLDVD